MRKLSPRQQQILAFVRDFMQRHGLPPTVRDIQRGCGISSTSVVDYNLHILQREGVIRRTPEVARGIELLEDPPRTRPERAVVPVVGYIAAGEPLPVPGAEGWSDAPLETLEVPSRMARSRESLYALRVKGTSMIDALIDDGDVVVIEPVKMARNGDTVVARLQLENEVTLKKFYHEGDRVRLQPCNSQMEPLYVDPENVEVQGRVVGVLRFLR